MVAVWISLLAFIRNVTVVPRGTLSALGMKAKNDVPPLPCAPTSTVLLPGAGVFASALAVFSVDASCLRSVARSCAAVGIFELADTTFTIPVMPGWTSQKYRYVPAFVNLTVIGFGLLPSGRPPRTALAPVELRDLPNAEVSPSRLKPSCGCPLNQNGAPAASTTPVMVCAAGVISGSFRDRWPGRSTVWKLFGTNRTLSPTWIVALCGKKSLTSFPVALIAFEALFGGPRLTSF